MNDHIITIEQEIADVSAGRPHVLLLGAGASFAALPNGDKNGRKIPLLREVAGTLGLVKYFPDDLVGLAVSDFEAAYSQLFDRGRSAQLDALDTDIGNYFRELELPDSPNLYDVINLSLRDKDAIFTFNWDPFLIQSRARLARLGIAVNLPKLFFLHGNVLIGYCEKDKVSGLVGNRCSKCHDLFAPSRLLFPVEHKDYNADPFIHREWNAAQYYLEHCSMFTVFGYSAPVTDIEAVGLLKKAWGDPARRELEQTEVINRPGADHDALRNTWDPFIHSHHYDVFDSFYESFIAKHPRRSIEAYWQQYMEAKFISDHTVPDDFATLGDLADWFRPLIMAEIVAKNST